MIRRMLHMRPRGLRDNPTPTNLIRRPLGDDGKFLGLEGAALQRRHQQVFRRGHLDVIRVRLDVDLARCSDELDAQLMRKQADPILDPRHEILSSGDLRGLLADDIQIAAGGDRGGFTTAHG